MKKKQEAMEIFRKYGEEIGGGRMVVGKSISQNKLGNAAKSFARGVDSSEVIGFMDVTTLGSGKEGYLFAEKELYYKEPFCDAGWILYDDIEKIIAWGSKTFEFVLKNGESVCWTGKALNKVPLYKCLLEFFEFKQDEESPTTYGFSATRPHNNSSMDEDDDLFD